MFPFQLTLIKQKWQDKRLKRERQIINDIGGAKFDPLMPEVMAQSGAYVILMHNRKPNLNETNCITTISGELTEYEDIVDTVKAELKECIDLVKVAGVPDDKIIIDPGIGFAKTVEGNIELMQRVSELT